MKSVYKQVGKVALSADAVIFGSSTHGVRLNFVVSLLEGAPSFVEIVNANRGTVLFVRELKDEIDFTLLS